jgi:ATP-dependent Clp protease ATP-binding subunit ClpB
MTSNIGSQYILDVTDRKERNRRVMDALRAHFRPEFLNRVDEIIIFDRLTEDELVTIVDIQLRRVIKRLSQRNLQLTPTDAAKKLLAKEGFDAVFGARPLKRTIQRDLLDPLSLELLEGKFKEGDSVVADVVDGRIRFKKK